MHKEVVHAPNGILLNDEKNEKMPTAATYTDLDIEKDKLYLSVEAENWWKSPWTNWQKEKQTHKIRKPN